MSGHLETVRNFFRDPGQASAGGREPVLVGVEVPAGEAGDQQAGLGGGHDGGRVGQPVQVEPRVDEQEAEADGLVSLGARRVGWDSYPDDPDFVVLADPDGNRFCIVNLVHSCD